MRGLTFFIITSFMTVLLPRSVTAQKFTRDQIHRAFLHSSQVLAQGMNNNISWVGNGFHTLFEGTKDSLDATLLENVPTFAKKEATNGALAGQGEGHTSHSQLMILPLGEDTEARRQVFYSKHDLELRTPMHTTGVGYHSSPEVFSLSFKNKIKSRDTSMPELTTYKASLAEGDANRQYAVYETNRVVVSERARKDWYASYARPVISEVNMETETLSAMKGRLAFFSQHAKGSNVSLRAKKNILALVHEVEPLFDPVTASPTRYEPEDGVGFFLQGPRNETLMTIEIPSEREIELALLRFPIERANKFGQPSSGYPRKTVVTVNVDDRLVSTKISDERTKVFGEGIGGVEQSITTMDWGNEKPLLTTWLGQLTGKPLPYLW